MPKLQVDETSDEELKGPAWWGDLVADTKPDEKEQASSSLSGPKLEAKEGRETKEQKSSTAPRPRLANGRREKYAKSSSQPNLMASLQEEASEAPFLWQKLAKEDKSSDTGKRSSKSSKSTRTSSPDHRRSSTGALDLRNSSDSIEKDTGRKHRKNHLDLPSSSELGRSRSKGGNRSSLAKLASLKDEGPKKISDDAVTLPPSLEHARSKPKPARRSSLTPRSSSNESPDFLEERQAKSGLPEHGRSRADHQSMLVKNLRSPRDQEHDRSAQYESDDDEDLSPEDKPQHQTVSHRLPSSSPRVVASSSLERPPVQANNGMFCPPQLQQNAMDRRATFGRPSLGRPSYSERKLSGLEPTENKPLRRAVSTDGMMDLMDDDSVDDDDDSSVCSRSRRGTAINFGSGGIVIPDVAGPNANFGKDKGKKSMSKKMLSALSFGVTGRNLKTEK
jgi:hypothetical protein